MTERPESAIPQVGDKVLHAAEAAARGTVLKVLEPRPDGVLCQVKWPDGEINTYFAHELKVFGAN